MKSPCQLAPIGVDSVHPKTKRKPTGHRVVSFFAGHPFLGCSCLGKPQGTPLPPCLGGIDPLARSRVGAGKGPALTPKLRDLLRPEIATGPGATSENRGGKVSLNGQPFLGSTGAFLLVCLENHTLERSGKKSQALLSLKHVQRDLHPDLWVHEGHPAAWLQPLKLV